VEGIGNSAAKKCARGVYKKLVDPTRGCDRADWVRFGAPLQNIKSVEDKLFSIFSFNHLVEELGGKPVRLAPLYSARAKYITMDSAGLYELLREHKRLPDNVKKIQEFHKRRLTHWRRLFRIRKGLLHLDGMDIVANKSYFNLMVNTDGVGASLVLYKWKLIANPPKSEPKTKAKSMTKAKPRPKRKTCSS
ncbi:hypothetical protein GGH95_000466, partial [Coemansia sp. RSA 1836]